MDQKKNRNKTFVKKVLSHLGCAGKIRRKSKKKKDFNKSMFDIRAEDIEPSYQLNKTRSMSHDCVFEYGSSFFLTGSTQNLYEDLEENNIYGGEIVMNNTYLSRSAYENYGFIDSLMRREKSLSSSLYETISDNNSFGQCSDKMLRKLEQRKYSSSNNLQNRNSAESSYNDEDFHLPFDDVNSYSVSEDEIPVFESIQNESITNENFGNFSGQIFALSEENLNFLTPDELNPILPSIDQSDSITQSKNQSDSITQSINEPDSIVQLNGQSKSVFPSNTQTDSKEETGTYFRLNKYNKNESATFYRPVDIYQRQNRFRNSTYDTSSELNMSDDIDSPNKLFFDNNKQIFYDPMFDELYVQNMQPTDDFTDLKTRWRASVNSNHDSAIGSEIDDSESMTLFFLTANQIKSTTADQVDYFMIEGIKNESDFKNNDNDMIGAFNTVGNIQEQNFLLPQSSNNSPTEIQRWIMESSLNLLESRNKYMNEDVIHKDVNVESSTPERRSIQQHVVAENTSNQVNLFNLSQNEEIFLDNMNSFDESCSSNSTVETKKEFDKILPRDDPPNHENEIDENSDVLLQVDSEQMFPLNTSPEKKASSIEDNIVLDNCLLVETSPKHFDELITTPSVNSDQNPEPDFVSDNEHISPDDNHCFDFPSTQLHQNNIADTKNNKQYQKRTGNESYKDFGSNKNIDKYGYRNTFKFIARKFSLEYSPMDRVSEHSVYLYKNKEYTGVKNNDQFCEKLTPYIDSSLMQYDYRKEWLILLKYNSIFWRNHPQRNSSGNRFESFYFKRYLNDSRSYNTTLILQNGHKRGPKTVSYLNRLLEAEKTNLLLQCALCEGGYNMRRGNRPFSKCFYCASLPSPASRKNDAIENKNNIEEKCTSKARDNEDDFQNGARIRVQYMVKYAK